MRKLIKEIGPPNESQMRKSKMFVKSDSSVGK